MESPVLFLQELEQRYGKSNFDMFFDKLKKLFCKSPDPRQPEAAEPKRPQILASTYGLTQPEPAKQPASCLAITCAADWERYRNKALQISAIESYLSACENEAQAATISRILNQYRNDVLKELATPEDFDEDSNLKFLNKLAKVIKNRLFVILKACSRKEGREKEFYAGLEKTIFDFFNGIGLVDDIPESDKKVDETFLEHCEIIPRTTNDMNLHMVLHEIIDCPRYFTYLDEDNKIAGYYIEGCLSIYKYQA